MTYKAWAVRNPYTGKLIWGGFSPNVVTWQTKAEALKWCRERGSGFLPVKVIVTVEEVGNG